MLTPNCPYFQIEEIRLKDHIFLRTGEEGFNLIAITRGHAVIRCEEHALQLGPGMICCIPACCGDYKVESVDEGAEMLRIQH